LRTLVLGGAGYIGSHMVRVLQRAGHDVTVFDDLSTGHREAIGTTPLVEGNMLDPAALDRAIDTARPDCVLHFAAKSLVGESMTDPGLYYRNNVAGTLCLLEALKRHAVPRLVFSSTAATYGNPVQDCIDEEHPTQPINTYGWSKLFAERVIADFCRSHGLRAVALRYFNAAGADPAGGIGEAHEPETHLIPNVLKAAAGLAPAVTLFGSDHPTPDGYCVRDFIHVNDLCAAHLLAADALLRDDLPAFQNYNLGTGRGYSVIEILRASERVVGKPIPAIAADRRAGDPPTLVASAAKARAILGWQPQLDDLDSIIGSAWAWHQSPAY